jgi:uncharacterized repeat protein (TIGR01451 family)
VDIAGATAATHVMTAADAVGDRTLRFEEIATNLNGTSRAVSRPSTIVQSIPPVNLTLPVLSGTARSGLQLSTTNGSWQSSSPVSYTYRWRRCTSGVCANIAGANSSTYTLTDFDVGTTVDVVVSATNTGGGTDANATATTSIEAAAPPAPPPAPAPAPVPAPAGGGGSGSGGGGGGSAPDLAVTGFVGNASALVGENATFALTVIDKNGVTAQQLYLDVSLPSGLQYVSSTMDRGSGCALLSASRLQCNLVFLSSSAPVAHVQVTAKVTAAGQQTLSATATAGQGELNPADNTVAIALNSPSSSNDAPIGLNGDGTPTKKQDKKAPTALALASTGKRGRAAQLRFKVYDNNGVAKVTSTVKRNGTPMATSSTGYGPVAYGSVYFLDWKVPANVAKGNYSFCVVAVDRAGNKSAQTCAPLALR